MPRRRQPDTARTGFFDADRHNEAFTLLCADSLRMGVSNAAFMFADRRCRVVTPAAYDLVLRATASLLMNEARYAEEDLTRAFEIDPTHDLVIAKVLEWGPSALQRMAAANFARGRVPRRRDPSPRDARIRIIGNAGRCENAD